MKQPIIKFLDYFGRVKEVKGMKAKNLKLIAELESVSFISASDKDIISRLINKLATPKSRWFVQPLNVNGNEIPWVREVQETIAKYLPKVNSKKEMDLIQKLFSASEDFFRYHEMFEQNMLFTMFIATLVVIVIAPIIAIYA